ncbi:Gldg family protein [Pedobacter sp. AW31-3R]|uniref:Gldg family protein n=1 Tax=Pedobacter sp. AW31-3R TaxID=3445781 RepID=UPI003F9FA638
MIKIFKIAKLELSILFYSPVAWLAIAIFMVQSGMGFLSLFQSFKEAISMGIPVDKLTYSVFPGLNGLYDTVQQHLYLYIPLITMGLMSREINSGSIKLLLSSPVKIREIILGKYLSMVCFALILVFILMIYAGAGMVLIKNPDIRLIISGMIGLFLLICTYSAIGLFMSSLTSYQVVAAISTLAVFAALRFVGNVGQGTDFLRDLTYFLSISGRADDMIKGLMTTRDVLYFLLIIFLFLYLCILRLKNGREAVPVPRQVLVYTLVVCSVLFAGYLTTRPSLTGYLDMTATKSRTLTKRSQEIAGQIEGTLEITTYVNLLDQNVYFGLPQSRNFDLEKFEQFRRFIPGLRMKYVYYYDAADLKNNTNLSYQGDLSGLTTQQIAEKVADNMGLDLDMFMPPSAIRKIIDLRSEENNLVRILRYKGRESRLRFYDEIDQFPSETEIAAAIQRLLVPAPRIAFISGHNERSIFKKGDRNYQQFSTLRRGRHALVNQGFEVGDLNLSREEIPDSLCALVLADPAAPLSPQEQQRVISFINKGGNMLITAEPGHQDLVNPLLEVMGLSMQKGVLVNPSKEDAPDVFYGSLSEGNGGLVIQNAAALTFSGTGGFQADTVLSSPLSGWIQSAPQDRSQQLLQFNAAGGDRKGSFPVVMALSRKRNGREQKIMVAADADFLSNQELSHPKGMNERFISRMFNWFSEGLFPVDTSRPAGTDNAILLSRRAIGRIQTGLNAGVPALILLAGAVVLIRRKRK